jgi:hypothetical protein
LIGSLTRTVDYLQLTVEPSASRFGALMNPLKLVQPTDGWTELEERRRLFWVIFLLDRYATNIAVLLGLICPNFYKGSVQYPQVGIPVLLPKMSTDDYQPMGGILLEKNQSRHPTLEYGTRLQHALGDLLPMFQRSTTKTTLS